MRFPFFVGLVLLFKLGFGVGKLVGKAIGSMIFTRRRRGEAPCKD